MLQIIFVFALLAIGSGVSLLAQGPGAPPETATLCFVELPDESCEDLFGPNPGQSFCESAFGCSPAGQCLAYYVAVGRVTAMDEDDLAEPHDRVGPAPLGVNGKDDPVSTDLMCYSQIPCAQTCGWDVSGQRFYCISLQAFSVRQTMVVGELFGDACVGDGL